MTFLTPPQLAPTWQHTPHEIDHLTALALESNRRVNDEIAKLPKDELNFENVFLALANAETELKLVIEPLSFYKNVSTSKELREAATTAEERHSKFTIQESMREDLYQAKVASEANLRKTGAWEKLNPEQKRLVEKMLLDDRRAGLALKKEDREKLKVLKAELSDILSKLLKHFNEEDGRITFTRVELDGVPEDVISGYTQRTEGDRVLYEATFKTPDINPILNCAHNPQTRRLAREALEARLAVNVEYMNTMFRLRREIAELLGYDSWADYVTEVQIVKSAAGIKEFLDSLQKYLQPIGQCDIEDLISMKKQDCIKRVLSFDENLYLWDAGYYERLYNERNLNLDESLVKEYFPVSAVVPAILNIYQDLLGVKFVEITGEAKDVWHPEVQEYAVWEKDAKDETDFLGYCYLDLYPRDNKFSHAAVWCHNPGYELPSGKRHYPVVGIVANLAKPTTERPALMKHFDVVIFFHEMGHVFHELLSRTQYSRFHGANVAIGFGEAPSQMLENWCWEPDVLKKMTSHYKTREPLPDDLIASILKSRYSHVGLFYLRQLFFATYDLVGGEGPGQAAFYHLMNEGVNYYSYTYSLVFSADMYATVFKNAPLDAELGKSYRHKILRPGGSQDEMKTLQEFLGRKPNPKAFINQIEQAGVLR